VEIDFNQLKEDMLFLNINELKEIVAKFNLASKGKKLELIHRILHFLKTEKELTQLQIPNISKAKKGVSYQLALDSLMLKGEYKNDLKTRTFFKELIGKHFHFTTFGIDWLNDRWLEGKPPTYQGFADMWSKEMERKVNHPVQAKKEWAYINFIKSFLQQTPNSSQTAIITAWEKERVMHKNKVYQILGNV
jgi:hypothetical protein